MHFLGIDAGGSHCRARLIDSAGTILGTGETGPANALIGMEALFAVVSQCCEQAIAVAGLTPAEIAQIRAGMGIAGTSRPGIREQLATMPFPFAAVAYATDGEVANLGAHHGADGAVLVIGTGSIAVVKVGAETFAIGGYGFPISDEGSGAALGLSAMRHALRALDGRTRPTPLSAAITERFDFDTRQAIAWMAEAQPRDYAALAPLVMAHAEADDAIARSIVEDAALHIERFVETIFNRGAPRCALAGGLAPHMRPWLRARTVARLTDPLGDPLVGALILAGFAPA